MRAPNRPALYPFQVETVAKINAKVAEGVLRPLVALPTGSGKTVIASELISEFVAAGRRVLFLVHRRELTKQSSLKLFSFGIDHGIIQAGFPTRPSALVQVASIATLWVRAVASRSIDLPMVDLIVVDEAHHARARTWRKIIGNYPAAVVVGLTATPVRADGKGLGGDLFQEILQPVTIRELIAQRYLVPTVTYAPVRPDLTGVRVERGDYVESQLAQRMNTQKLVGDIVEHWHKIGKPRRTVVFATGVAHSVHIRDEFRRSDVRAEHIDGTTPAEERDLILAELADGFIDVVTNCQVLTEGWDSPEVSCIVLARPTKSFGLYRQMVGRTLRPAPGKENALILDHAGAVFQHGFVDDPIAWELSEDRRAENKAHAARGKYDAPGLTTCPECHAVRFEGRPCSVCGWRPVAKPRYVEFEDGQLGVVNRNRSVDAPVFDEFEFYKQLLWLLQEKRQKNPAIKDGWAAHKFKDRVGRWPPYAWKGVDALIPTPDVRQWVRSRDIAYAKEMESAGRTR
jgi:DNA repair protein RadD